jgi:hypothetical protein
VQRELAEQFMAPLSAADRQQLYDLLRHLQAASEPADGEPVPS